MNGYESKWFWLVASTVTTLILAIITTVMLVKSISFDINCKMHLKRAADANSIELAQKELETVIDYIEKNNLMEGYTGILLKTPKGDLSFWYNNLKSALQNLNKVTPATSELEKTNILMKLRESILDQGKKGMEITVPPNVAFYPNQRLYIVQVFILAVCLIRFSFLR